MTRCLIALALACLAHSAQAQPAGAAGDAALAGLGLGGPGGNSYRATWLPGQAVRGQAARLGVVRQDLAASCPLYFDPAGVLKATVRVRSETFDTDAVLPDSGRRFPGDLWDIGLGLNGVYRLDNGWVLGGVVTVGSASDQPFADAQTLNARLISFLRVPSGERASWLFSLMYSPLGQLPFPIPGVAYSWNPSEELALTLGLPLSVRYRATPDWTLEASYMILTTVHAQATYRLGPGLDLYAAYDWANQNYYLRDAFSEAAGDESRFRSYEMSVRGGVRYDFSRSFGLDLSAGYAFDRRYNRGEGFDLSGTDEVEVEPGPFFSGRISWRW